MRLEEHAAAGVLAVRRDEVHAIGRLVSTYACSGVIPSARTSSLPQRTRPSGTMGTLIGGAASEKRGCTAASAHVRTHGGTS